MSINCTGNTKEGPKIPCPPGAKGGLEKYSQHSHKVKLLQQSAMVQLTYYPCSHSWTLFFHPRVTIILLLLQMPFAVFLGLATIPCFSKPCSLNVELFLDSLIHLLTIHRAPTTCRTFSVLDSVTQTSIPSVLKNTAL